jgi:hypothetical protein
MTSKKPMHVHFLYRKYNLDSIVLQIEQAALIRELHLK